MEFSCSKCGVLFGATSDTFISQIGAHAIGACGLFVPLLVDDKGPSFLVRQRDALAASPDASTPSGTINARYAHKD